MNVFAGKISLYPKQIIWIDKHMLIVKIRSDVLEGGCLADIINYKNN